MRAAAFDASLLACGKSLRAFAMKLCGNTAMADDIFQDTMLRALANHDKFQPGTNMKAWLLTIMRNEFCSQSRRAGRIILDVDDILSSTVPSASDQGAAYEAKDIISHIVLLVPDQRQVLLMTALGETMEEIGAKLRVPDGTVKSRIHRGRTALLELTQ